MTPRSPARAATADTPADDARPRTVVLLGFGAVGRPTGPAGRLELTFASAPSSDNPRTSQLTALSVTRTVRRARGLTPGG